MWLGTLLSTMGVMSERKVSFQKGEAVSELAFPEWDPEDREYLPVYPLADVFLNLAAWRNAHEKGDRAPEDYYGPLFSLAGYILDGVKEGFSDAGEEINGRVEEWFSRLFADCREEEGKGAAFLGQIERLYGLYLEYKKENGIA